ncbi:hypothetical protein N8933_11205 [Pseudomonadales bacterium]|nr:hypothetical protein [Pseudomonadales bacterium]
MEDDKDSGQKSDEEMKSRLSIDQAIKGAHLFLERLAEEGKVWFRVKQKDGTESLALYDPSSLKAGETCVMVDDDDSKTMLISLDVIGDRHPEGSLLGEEYLGKNVINFPPRKDD